MKTKLKLVVLGGKIPPTKPKPYSKAPAAGHLQFPNDIVGRSTKRKNFSCSLVEINTERPQKSPTGRVSDKSGFFPLLNFTICSLSSSPFSFEYTF